MGCAQVIFEEVEVGCVVCVIDTCVVCDVGEGVICEGVDGACVMSDCVEDANTTFEDAVEGLVGRFSEICESEEVTGVSCDDWKAVKVGGVERRLVEMEIQRGEGGDRGKGGDGIPLPPCELPTLSLLPALPTTTGVTLRGLAEVSDFFTTAPVPGLLALFPLSPLRRKSHTCSSSPPPTVTHSHPNTSPDAEGLLPQVSMWSCLRWSSRYRGTRSSSGGQDIVRV